MGTLGPKCSQYLSLHFIVNLVRDFILVTPRLYEEKKSKLHLVIFVCYHTPSLTVIVTDQMLQGIFTKHDSELQSVSKQNHSCKLQLYKISAYDKKRPKVNCQIFSVQSHSLRLGQNYHLFTLHMS